MSLSKMVTPELPYLRRYARALTGSQASGDAYVAATLAAMIEDKTLLNSALPTRLALYKVFQAIWSSADFHPPTAKREGQLEAMARERLKRLAPLRRQALLLTALEGFAPEEASMILGVSRAELDQLAIEAQEDIAKQMRTRVLIIEDETLIAMDLSDIVSRMGHEVVAIADTAAKAVEEADAYSPGIVLADIQLGDGSSGVDAVEEILQRMRAPVVFVTAFPDRLLTGSRPEPVYLITKPYLEDTVQAAVSQALFFSSMVTSH